MVISFVNLRSGNLPAVKACPATPLATYSRLSGLGRDGAVSYGLRGPLAMRNAAFSQ